MLVIATAVGFYGQLRIPGTGSAEFEVPEGTNGSWFKPVDVPEDEATAARRPRKPKGEKAESDAADGPA